MQAQLLSGYRSIAHVIQASTLLQTEACITNYWKVSQQPLSIIKVKTNEDYEIWKLSTACQMVYGKWHLLQDMKGFLHLNEPKHGTL